MKALFTISPALLKHVSEVHTEAELNSSKLKVVGGRWAYVTVLGRAVKAQQEAIVKEVVVEKVVTKKVDKDEEMPF